ncbi:N-acetyltransferase [Sphingomonas solaris]|uniref:N-acetyltransferase n=1 Tax=Alterirhizorhabdus solaris TaxID=2529389 RepID=A0A558R1Y5_9SPHN|nr:N-acetyltransferase [Sphingomonas solaris]TVV73390.1 N-acetyltransferase [Sphingomonas solaris]
MPTIAPLGQADPAAVEALLDVAFGTDRHGRTAYRIREGMGWLPSLSLAGFDGTTLVATLQCWPVALIADDDRTLPLVLLGPVAVAPERQRDGIGRRLIETMFEAATGIGARDFVLIGDPEYYGRFFGFTDAATGGWRVPGPVERHRLLARLATPGDWPATGTLGPRRPS